MAVQPPAQRPIWGGEPLYSGFVDRSLATPEAARLMDIDWRTQRNRQRHERETGLIWPKTETGRNYDGHHKIPRSEGGSDGPDNFVPMHPDDHRKHHMDNGDFRRWGALRRKKGPVVKGLGWLGIIPNITGLLSGRIRTDTPDNMLSDLFGVPSEEDRRKAYEEQQRAINPKWKPGDPMGV